mmetsp:Transcript_66430/g.105019  ORF Transcript_66430/g.105019 Transcript_66430/m.105019 type:complete len:604 (-) Transcript_66430:313-2124(-)
MKFGLNIDSQQQDNNDLHYVDYNLLKQRIKDVVAMLGNGELSAALTTNTSFEEDLAVEIGQVNACFELRRKSLLDQIAHLSEELAQKGDLQMVGDEQQHAAFRRLVEMLQEMDRLRKYAVWNAVAIVKILKKRRKQTRFGIEDSSVERAGWLSRQSFFSGSEFAELHVALESLGHAVVCAELGAGSYVRSNLLEKGETKQQCPICLETISDVVELSCKHHFCWKCFVLGPIAFQPGEYRMTQCPICRQDATDPLKHPREQISLSSSLMPRSEGALSQFLHTYFASDVTSDVRENDQPDHEEMDVVGQLVKVVLADSTWQRPVQDKAIELLEKSSGRDPSPESSCTRACSSCVPSDFFQTLPPKPSQDDKAQMYRAQKLQWLQIASSNDPLALEADMYCPLCSEPLLMEAVVTTPCKHHMHQVCLRRLELPVCPLCPTELPFSWFLPNDNAFVERGFRVVPASQYKPAFPGGPNRKCSGYPLHQPPPTMLRGLGGMTMRSYLHRAPPMGVHEDECDSRPTSPTIVEKSAGKDESASSGSESSSDESNSNFSEGEEEKTPSPGGRSKHQKGKGSALAYTSLGKMRMLNATKVLNALNSSSSLQYQ